MTYNASNPKSLTLSGKYFSSLLGQRDRPVLGRVALTEHIEINAVQNQNFHRRSGIRMPWEWRL